MQLELIKVYFVYVSTKMLSFHSNGDIKYNDGWMDLELRGEEGIEEINVGVFSI